MVESWQSIIFKIVENMIQKNIEWTYVKDLLTY